jgi:hypothetical protein
MWHNLELAKFNLIGVFLANFITLSLPEQIKVAGSEKHTHIQPTALKVKH